MLTATSSFRGPTAGVLEGQIIELRHVAEAAVNDLRGESGVAGVELMSAANQVRGIAVIGLDTLEDLEGRDARRGNGHEPL